MSKNVKANLMKYGITIGVGLMLAYTYVALKDFETLELVGKYRVLCDAFTIPGVLLLMSGLLVTVANEGALDGVGYILSQGLSMLIPGKGAGTERYADYVERKRNNRTKGYGFLYICAILFLAVTAVFMILFYSVYQK